MWSMMEGGKKTLARAEGVGLTGVERPRWFFSLTSNFVGTGLKFELETSMTGLYGGWFFVFISTKLGFDKLDSSSSASNSVPVVLASVVAAGGAA